MRILCLAVLAAASACAQSAFFDQHDEVGAIGIKGETVFDPRANSYRIAASGANIWANTDAFHYAWKQVSGDITITTSIGWETPGGNPHKKAGPMLRATLGADSPHASVMVHADGLISLQYRREKGGPTLEVRSVLKAPARVRLARHGDVISYEVARDGEPFQPAGAVIVAMPETLHAGLAVCSHNNEEKQTALFTGVAVELDGVAPAKERVVESTLEIVDIRSGERRILHRAIQHFEAPNWTPDGSTLIFNGGGKIYRIPVAGGAPELIPTGEVRCNNDHGISPDGKTLVISGSINRGQSQIFTLPMTGGEPKLITPRMPSYWHGWSPDGKTLAYCASRDGEYDIYTIPVDGGEETRLTTAKGLDDGPEYSPDGKMIYFNSVRSGLMRIWGMNADGTDQRMISQGPETADWFAHFSPDGKWIAYVAYDKSVEGHPPNKEVTIQLAQASGASPRTLVTLFGGQGTMNVPSWSPDSTKFAFVSYRLVKKR